MTSWNCGAGCKINHHSIPAMELCGGLAVTEAATEYIWNHIDSLFPINPPPAFQVAWTQNVIYGHFIQRSLRNQS